MRARCSADPDSALQSAAVPILCRVEQARSPRPRRPSPRRRRRRLVGRSILFVLALLGVAGIAVAAGIVWWSGATLAGDRAALARIEVQPLGGSLVSAKAFGPGGARIPLVVRGSRLTPKALLRPGERVTVEVVVRRPGWLGWALGRSRTERLTLHTPVSQLASRWLTRRSTRTGAPPLHRPGRQGRLRNRSPDPRRRSRRPARRVARAAAARWDLRDCQRRTFVGTRRRSRARDVVPRHAAAGRARQPRTEPPDLTACPHPPHLLAAGRRRRRRVAATLLVEGLWHLAGGRQSHAALHADRPRLPARHRLAPRAPAYADSQRRRHDRRKSPDGRLEHGSGQSPPAPAAARRRGLPPGRLAPVRRPRGAGAARGGGRRERAAQWEASSGAIRTRHPSSLRNGHRGSPTRSRAAR